jgi:hypothetical protein
LANDQFWQANHLSVGDLFADFMILYVFFPLKSSFGILWLVKDCIFHEPSVFVVGS